jgi:nucleoside-diphosphate-sugar epimerase
MRVFVAGATGVLGRATIPRLIAAGHEVIGLARTPEKLLDVTRLGATPERGDVLDAATMNAIVAKTQPQAIVNLATAIPLKLRVNAKDWEPNDRIRTEGTHNLLNAARQTNCKLFVQESVGYVCAPHSTNWLTEESPLSAHPFLQATQQMERQVQQSTLPATLLRFAALTAADSWHTQQSIVALRRGLLPIVGDGTAWVSLISVEDAAAAILLTLENADTAAGKIYNVVDNDPDTMRAILTYAAECLHASPPRQVPALMAKMIVGSLTLEVFTASYRMSNARIRQELGFAPQFPTYRELWRHLAQQTAGKNFAASHDLNG